MVLLKDGACLGYCAGAQQGGGSRAEGMMSVRGENNRSGRVPKRLVLNNRSSLPYISFRKNLGLRFDGSSRV